MVFSSLLFIFVFLPIALTVFYGGLFATQFNRNVFFAALISLSLLFYFWGSGKMVLLLITSILFNWVMGKQIVHSKMARKKVLLTTGIMLNLSALFYFKYCRFILDSLGSVTTHTLLPTLHPYLPVGISFYTFMTISYLVEVYRSEDTQASLLEFGTYLSLFPHLVAGPIVRFSEITNDLRNRNSLSINHFFDGITRFTQGLAMKVLIADNLSPTADKIFSLAPSAVTFATSWLGALTYTFQIYFDFAGYSAMAIGLALMFGFHFPENFNRPYIAHSITEFWRRWHMSLSHWLRDYVYIPLGGNKKGSFRTYVNLFAVFFICGLWHGAAWTFVVWGLYQGVLLIVERALKNNFSYENKGVLGITITFILTMIGWVIFRATSFEQCGYFIKAMFSWSGGPDIPDQLGEYMDPLLLVALFSAAVISFFPSSQILQNEKINASVLVFGKIAVTASLLVFVAFYAVGNSFIPFIYFRF
jgi:alginate O-acetyltransferase complex protein AlgI